MIYLIALLAGLSIGIVNSLFDVAEFDYLAIMTTGGVLATGHLLVSLIVLGAGLGGAVLLALVKSRILAFVLTVGALISIVVLLPRVGVVTFFLTILLGAVGIVLSGIVAGIVRGLWGRHLDAKAG